MTKIPRARRVSGLFAVAVLAMAATSAIAQRPSEEKRAIQVPFAGSLVICKALAIPPNFIVPAQWNFSVAPGNHSMVTPYKGCSTALTLPAGTYVITEQSTPLSYMNACSATPAGSQVACNWSARTSTIIVHANATTTATIVNALHPPCVVPCT